MGISENPMSWTDLAGAVDEGKLYLEEGVGARCAAYCTDFVDALKKLREVASFMGNVDGFGTFPSGIALAEKFSRKAVGGDYSMVQALTDHIAEVEAMRDVFLRIEAQYVAADESSAQALGAIGPDL